MARAFAIGAKRSKSIRDGAERVVDRPWHAIDPYDAPLPVPERFEVYPNRDSTAFVGQYGFDPDWILRDFVRGTIRLKGWAEAWAPVFVEVEGLAGPEGDARLREMAEEFWSQHAYAEGEPDRVVLFVRLAAERDGARVITVGGVDQPAQRGGGSVGLSPAAPADGRSVTALAQDVQARALRAGLIVELGGRGL